MKVYASNGLTYRASTLEEVKAMGDRNLGETRSDIIISDDNGREIMRRRWIPDIPGYGKEGVITCGDWGHYGPWEETER